MRSRLCTLKINVSLVFSSQIVRWESSPGAIASSGRTGNRPVSRRTDLKIIRLVIIFTVLAGVVVAQNRRCEIIRGLDVHRVVRAFVSLRPRLHGSAQLEFLEIQSENPKAWIRTCTAFSNCFATSFGKREGCTPSRWIGTLRSNRKLSGTWSRIPSSRLSNCRIHYLKMYMTLRKKDVGERRHFRCGNRTYKNNIAVNCTSPFPKSAPRRICTPMTICKPHTTHQCSPVSRYRVSRKYFSTKLYLKELIQTFNISKDQRMVISYFYLSPPVSKVGRRILKNQRCLRRQAILTPLHTQATHICTTSWK